MMNIGGVNLCALFMVRGLKPGSCIICQLRWPAVNPVVEPDVQLQVQFYSCPIKQTKDYESPDEALKL